MSDINDDYIYLALKLQRISPDADYHVIIKLARELILANRKLQRLAENACNVGSTPADERTEANIKARLEEILKPFGICPIIGGDPRGCVLKLEMPDGSTNDFARTGWCVPI